MNYFFISGSSCVRIKLNFQAHLALEKTQIDLRNSGDTSGLKDSVVGYGAFHLKQID